jgi:hypothetical protein
MISAKPDVVLIHPNSRLSVYQSLGRDLAAVENPVWAGLIAAFCRRKKTLRGTDRCRSSRLDG